jgi:hypothetical protein
MKNITVTIAGIKGIEYAVPSTLTELSSMISEDRDKGDAVALNAATQYFLQQNLIRIRDKIADKLASKFQMALKLFIGKTEVVATVDGDGEVNGYKAVEGKKTFKANETPKSESAKEFIDRVIAEKQIDEKTIRKIVESACSDIPFTAEQKRVRGSVQSKPVGKKWLALAEKIIAAGNGESAASKLSAELGQTLAVTGEDGVKRLALALAEKSRRAMLAVTSEAEEQAGTEESPLVVAGA